MAGSADRGRQRGSSCRPDPQRSSRLRKPATATVSRLTPGRRASPPPEIRASWRPGWPATRGDQTLDLVRSGRFLGVLGLAWALGPVSALGPVGVLGAATRIRGAPGVTVTAGGCGAGRTAAVPWVASRRCVATSGERMNGRRRRNRRARGRDLADHVMPGRDLVAGRGNPGGVVQLLEFADLAALH